VGLFLGIALLSCVAAPPDEVAPWPALVAATDVDADPRVTRLELSARPTDVQLAGAATSIYRYTDRHALAGGSGFQPLIVDLEVGDRLVVDFRNELPVPTTIHWHGLRLPSAMDGNPVGVGAEGHVHDVSAIRPGGSFVYDFQVKDAGVFWFHPHVRADEQVDKGLYGVLRVRPRGTPKPTEDAERVVVLDDLGLKTPGDTDEDHDVAQLGRGGETILVNGSTAEGTLELARRTMLRFVNAANGRFFNLALPGYAFFVVGTDGGKYPEPFVTNELLLVPGERIDAYVVPSERSSSRDASVELRSLPYDRGHGSSGEPSRLVARVVVTGDEDARSFESTRPMAPPARLVSPKTVPIVLGQPKTAHGAPVAFTLNGESFMGTPIRIPLGTTWELDVANETTTPHPFHLHGFFFQVLDRGGVPEPPGRRVWKDTVLIPKNSHVRVAATFDEVGLWMVHCHILEHAERGMMGHLLVEGP
jgi:FtsP/CotA-like multicopper oxidase with cupredoxin domain